MSLRDRFLGRLSREYAWVPAGAEMFHITEYRGEKLARPVRLHLDEQQFERYALWIARTCEDGDIDAGLGLIYIHLDEELAADRPWADVTDIGLRRGRVGRPKWFSTLVPASNDAVVDPDQPRFLWVADPPPR